MGVLTGRTLPAAALVLLAASAAGWWLGQQRGAATPEARVVEAIDGDTIVVAFDDGRTDTVRLLGVDTPETHHPTQGVECFGPEAAAFTASRLTGRAVRLEGDVEARDQYGRRLAHVLVDGRRFNDVLLAAWLRASARDRAEPRPHAEGLAAELDARRAERGLWAACGDD